MAFTLSTNPIVQKKQLAEMIERSQRMLVELTLPVDLCPEYRKATPEDVYPKSNWSEYLPPSSRFSSLRAGRSAWNPGSD